MELTEKTAQTGGPGDGTSGRTVSLVKLPSLMHEERCRLSMLWTLHPRGAFCPSCRVELSGKRVGLFWLGKRIRCASCGTFFTALTDTVFAGMHLDFCEMAILVSLLQAGIGDREVAAILDDSQGAIGHRRRKLEDYVTNAR